MIIVSTGRTGTTWLAKLLNEVPGVCAVHEPLRQEQFAWVEAFNSAGAAGQYAEFRLRYMCAAQRRQNCSTYVEANGALRRHVRALKEIAPEIYIPHVIRDGRDVVTSIMNRRSITIADPIYHFVGPDRHEHGYCWRDLSRFEKACWLWRIENEFMAESCDHTVRFEDMLTDYVAFFDAFCRPLGIGVSKEVWARSLRTPENSSQSESFPTYEGWSEREKAFFVDCCGDTMRRFGYSLSGLN